MPILITESPLELKNVSQHLDRYPCYNIHVFITVFMKHRCAVNNVDACVQLIFCLACTEDVRFSKSGCIHVVLRIAIPQD